MILLKRSKSNCEFHLKQSVRMVKKMNYEVKMHPEKFLDYNVSHSMFDFLTVPFQKKS